MKLLNVLYKNKQTLQKEIEENKLFLAENLLIQIFTSSTDIDFIKQLISSLKLLLPNAKIIGATTSGGICNGKLEEETILSFCTFEKTKINTYIIEGLKDSFETGKKLIEKLPNPKDANIKAAICFSDSLITNGEEFLNGISFINPSIVIAGGMASDNLKYTNNYVFNEESIVSHGAVLATLENPTLNIITQHSFNWQPIGKPHIVTKSYKNRVYTIDNKTTLDFYREYLGENIDELLPEISLEFPLIITNRNFLKGRAVVEVHKDGSFSYSGNINQGEIIKFGYANTDLMLDKSKNDFELLSNLNIDAIFIYSCIARKLFLKENIALEIAPYNQIAPSSGFFTYGEFFHEQKEYFNSKLLNQAMTILALSEDNCSESKKEIVLEKKEELSNQKDVVLNHIISKITNELDDLTLNLRKKVENEIKKNEEKDLILNITHAQAEVGYMLEMIAHQWRQPLSAISTIASFLQLRTNMNQLDAKEINSMATELLDLSKYAHETIEDFRNLFKNKQKFEKIEIHLLIKKVRNILKTLFIQNNIKIEEEYLCEKNCKIDVPLGQTLQILINILKNAVEALVDNKIRNPKIKICIEEIDEFYIFHIEDNAGGIQEEILTKIFNKRFSTKKEHGTGLGLDICKSIIEKNLNGSITAKNTKEGALFQIMIPS